MNRLTATFFTLLAGLLLGFLAARSWSEANKPAPAPEASPKTRHAANPPHDDSTVATQTGRTPTSRPATNDSGTPPAVTPATTHPAHIPIARILPPEDSTVRIPRKFLSKIQCMVFNTTSNCVTDDIVELLNISPEERERLDHLITTTRTKVEEHELDRATVTEQLPQRVVLKIAANPDTGHDLEDAFVAEVKDTLGDRAVTFLERAQPYESTLFSNFGRNDTTLTVTRDENSSLLRVQSQQEYVTPNGGHGSVSSTTMSNQMPDRWKKFFQAP